MSRCSSSRTMEHPEQGSISSDRFARFSPTRRIAAALLTCDTFRKHDALSKDRPQSQPLLTAPNPLNVSAVFAAVCKACKPPRIPRLSPSNLLRPSVSMCKPVQHGWSIPANAWCLSQILLGA